MPASESAVQTAEGVQTAAPSRTNISHGPMMMSPADLDAWTGWTGSPAQHGNFQESRPSTAMKQGNRRSASPKSSKDDERLKEAKRQIQALGPEAVVAVPWTVVEGTYKVGESVGIVPAFKRMIGGITGLGAGTSR